MKYFIVLFLILSFQSIQSVSHSRDLRQKEPPPYAGCGKEWVDSVFSILSPEERIAQLIFVAAYSDHMVSHEVAITDLIRDYKIGGLIFFQGDPLKQAELTNFYQSQSKVPLLIAMDGEWGLGMRLSDIADFPYQMSLGAIQDDSLIYEMGSAIAAQCKRLGVHVNLAPVVDINNNPENPVINFRSFGEDKFNVAGKAEMYMKGLQDNGILAVAKHFPGHGDTNEDSHFILPVLDHSVERIDSLELYPYKRLIEMGLGGIMTAHLNIPALDSTRNLASTLSKPVITGLLRQELGFEGLIFTDALNMKAITDYFPPGVADAKALLAGNDILEYTEDVAQAIKEIESLIESGQITMQEIDNRCRKILTLKYWAGLDNYSDIETDGLIHDLNPVSSELLNHKLVKTSITVLRNKQDLVPLKNLEKTNIATLAVGAKALTPFQLMLDNYTKMTHFCWHENSDSLYTEELISNLKRFDLIISGVVNLNQRSDKQYGITERIKELMKRVGNLDRTITVVFGNAYSLNSLSGIEESDGLIVTYQDNRLFQELAAQLIFGGFGATGKLPVKVNRHFLAGDGLNTEDGIRLQYAIPEAVGMNSTYMNRAIDSVAEFGIRKKAFPGCQVLVARKGVVVFHKTYGYHTYNNLIPVQKNDLYDFASVTKITGPLPAMMKLYDEGKYTLDDPFSSMWPDFKKGDKSNIIIRDILAHQAGLIAWIPYWQKTVRQNGSYRWHTIKRDSSSRYNVRISEDLYLHKNYKQKIYRAIRKSSMRDTSDYLYSGLCFYLFPEIIQNLTGVGYETYLKKNFYQPLGAYTIIFNPYLEYPVHRIIPTENDDFFRMRQIHGWVHDEGAAMMGGVSGNAGLFATINDLAKLMQMYLQMGTYGGEEYISRQTMKEFTSCQFPDNKNRRGLGFDKPLIDNTSLPPDEAYPAVSASSESFGHSGYTGTFTWVDPSEELLYIFFSNRVYPTRYNEKIYDLNIRTSIQQALYDAIEE
ncbi:MAG: serine hydrolase [Bacteroidales bacterium]|nr:MAG: serine hydrolase [Bacteroidales bacterium]